MKLCNISKSYGDKVIFQDYNDFFEQGQRYCLMGESGRGKTTLLRMIAGLESYDSGMIVYHGEKKFSMVFQENRLFEWETVEKNLCLVQNPYQKETIEEHLQRVCLQETLQKKVSELSGGMKRRVAIVRAMLFDSSIILMDEPFTGFDGDTKKAVIQYLLEEQRKRTMVISTHAQEDVDLLKAKKILL